MDKQSLKVVGGPVTVTSDGRRYFSSAHKEAVVAKCLAPGASVSAVASTNGFRTDLVRKWVRQHEVRHRGSSAKLLPVRIEAQRTERALEGLGTVAAELGSIELRAGGIELTVRGRVEHGQLELMLNAVLRAR